VESPDCLLPFTRYLKQSVYTAEVTTHVVQTVQTHCEVQWL